MVEGPLTERPATTSFPPVEAEGVSVHYGGVRALQDVTLTLYPNEIAGLIGPNGAGKSTLVGVVAGTIRPQEGRVVLGGRDVSRQSPIRRAKLGLARTFQHPELFATLTVEENLGAGHELRNRIGRAETAEQQNFLDELLNILDLRRWMAWRAEDVPHPVQRMVETARAMYSAAPVLLVDEPAAGLTEPARERLVTALKGYCGVFDASVLVVEHDVPLVLKTCDRITVLHEGRVLANDTPEVIRRDPGVIDAYFGAPA